MTAPETLPSRAQLDHDTVLDALLAADMRNEAAVEWTGRAARRAQHWATLFAVFALPLICLVGVALINLRWPL